MKTRRGNVYLTQLKFGLLVLVPFIAIMFITEQCKGQDYDSLKRAIAKVDAFQEQMEINLNKAHHQYKDGTILVIAGALFTASTFLQSHLAKEERVSNWVYAGPGLSLIGAALQIDSHKFFGRRYYYRKNRLPK